MKQTVTQIKFDTNKYQALKRYAVKKEVSLEQELEDTLVRLYKNLCLLMLENLLRNMKSL